MSCVFKQICQKRPSADHFQLVLKIASGVMLCSTLAWLMCGFGSLWMPGGVIQVVLVGITLWQWDVLITHPTATSTYHSKRIVRVEEVQSICFSSPQTYPKQSVLPHKHKGTSVNPAPCAQLMLQVSFYNPRNKLKAVGGLGFCFVFNQPLHFFLWNGKKKSSRNLSISYFGFSLVFQIPVNSFPEFEMVSTCSVSAAKLR